MTNTHGSPPRRSRARLALWAWWGISSATALTFQVDMVVLLARIILALAGTGVAGFYVLGALEALSWLAAGLTSALVARRLVPPAAATAAATAAAVFVAGLGFVLFNWSVYEKRSYYVAHRWQFAQLAEGYRDGSLRSEEYYGTKLPPLLRPMSANGKVSTFVEVPGLFLPQHIGIPDDAVGYVYLSDADPATLGQVDLYGRIYDLAEAEPVGDGWYWTG